MSFLCTSHECVLDNIALLSMYMIGRFQLSQQAKNIRIQNAGACKATGNDGMVEWWCQRKCIKLT